MNKYTLLLIGLILNISTAMAQKNNAKHGEIIYHVFQRSFYDSNGDKQGDLNGLKQKLGYLKDLGISSILLLPLYDADFYHNYFANDFEKIDAEFGSMEDYISLVKEIHHYGMKVYMDMETQYITAKHLWWKDAVGNLQSPYSDYVLFDDPAHTTPSSMLYGMTELNSYDGSKIKVATVNLKSQKVLDYNIKLYSFFIDPNKDGKFDDGVDGFRLDHAMDNLDGKAALTNLFADFWKPLITSIKKVNPALKIVAEQADWSDYGFEYFDKAGVDRVFGFKLRSAILSFNKQQLINVADTTLKNCPKGKDQIVFIENHDLDRSASVEKNPEKQRVAAALMMLIGGIPSIYYGQEIGMKGTSLHGKSDGNDIPRREAYDWYAAGEGNGTATWYKNTGEWWTKSNLKANDGISLEEEMKDSKSLFNDYKKLIALKHSNPALANGAYDDAENDNSQVFSFYRIIDRSKTIVVVNLSGEMQKVILKETIKKYKHLLGEDKIYGKHISLKPYEVIVGAVK